MVPVMNCLSDKKIQLAGSTSHILRVTQKAPEKQTVTDWMDAPRNDVFGDYVQTLETEIIGSVIINYPLNGAEVFADLNYEEDQIKTETTAIDLNEFFLSMPYPESQVSGDIITSQRDLLSLANDVVDAFADKVGGTTASDLPPEVIRQIYSKILPYDQSTIDSWINQIEKDRNKASKELGNRLEQEEEEKKAIEAL